MGEQIVITKHAEERMKERLGITKKAMPRAAQRAFVKGLVSQRMEGRLQKYIDYKDMKHNGLNSETRIYGEYVYCFTRTDNIYEESVITLVTVYQVPNDLKKNAKSQLQRVASF